MILIKKNFNALVVLIAIIIQLWINAHFLHTKPDIEVTTPPPGYLYTVLNSLGDAELAFRRQAFELQYMGDTFGRTTSLYKYDYKIINKWFYALDKLNNYSDFTPSIADYYFGSVLDNKKKQIVVDYLFAHSKDRIKEKWWWMYQASFICFHFIKDDKQALKIAYMLHDTKDKIPVWARQLPAFIYEKRGEKEHAFAIIDNIIRSFNDISPHELNFMNHFIKERLKDLEKN